MKSSLGIKAYTYLGQGILSHMSTFPNRLQEFPSRSIDCNIDTASFYVIDIIPGPRSNNISEEIILLMASRVEKFAPEFRFAVECRVFTVERYGIPLRRLAKLDQIPETFLHCIVSCLNNGNRMKPSQQCTML